MANQKNTTGKNFAAFITALLVLLFVYTASDKLFHFDVFKNQLERSPFIGGYNQWVAVMLPVCELLIAGMLVFNTTKKIGLYAFLLLMLLFTGYIIAMLLSGKHLPCSCGGVLKQMTWKQHIVFNLFFVGLAITVIVLEYRTRNKEYGTWK
jgi:hypothetical protein